MDVLIFGLSPQSPIARTISEVAACKEEMACFVRISLSNYTVFAPEITMPKVNLSGMNVEALMDLRNRVEARLVEHRAQLEKQLERMGTIKSQSSSSLGLHPFMLAETA
jgi:hypothetical protein